MLAVPELCPLGRQTGRLGARAKRSAGYHASAAAPADTVGRDGASWLLVTAREESFVAPDLLRVDWILRLSSRFSTQALD